MPKVPCRATFAEIDPLDVSGLRTYHATPARFPSATVTAVSRALQSLPFAYITCWIRVSFESGLEMTSLPGAPTSRRQQPVCPLNSTVVVLLMQCPCGVLTPGAVPEPGCLALGGSAYVLTPTTWLESARAGAALLSDVVLVRAQATIWLEMYWPPKPATGCVASSAAFELRKYSVPPAFESNEDAPGDWAGHTVKPGWVDPASLATLTAPKVSMCCIVAVATPAASWAFENA